ncbi:MAG: amino acid ABC transporter permease, partial [Oscillospiraceae bacterium]|nr:amino acid ABC transporter permease [Oscillospiraceae bacterium]
MALSQFADKFYKTFIQDDRWKYLTNGLKNTLKITVFAVLLGMVLGFFIAIVRATHDKTGKLSILNFF